MNWEQLFEAFNNIKALVIGDIMLDKYIEGSVSRISPEAPVPVVLKKREYNRAGGAANVAINMKELGASVEILSIAGKDSNADILIKLLYQYGVGTEGILKDAERPTTTKTRIIGNQYQVLRIDEETTDYLKPNSEKAILSIAKELIEQNDVVVLQDYDKGFFSKSVINSLIDLCKKLNKPILVDPKLKHFLDYKNITLMKPNRKELVEGLGLVKGIHTIEEIKEAMLALQEKINCTHVLCTLSEDGILALNDQKFIHFPAHRREIVDVSGAGDTVIATSALCLASNASLEQNAALSNLAGGQVCEKSGVAPVNKKQLLKEALQLKL